MLTNSLERVLHRRKRSLLPQAGAASPDEPGGAARLPLSVRGALAVVAGCAIGAVLSYALCALLRLPFPWDLEWMEGGMITHAARVLQGKPLYAPPSIDFVAYFYTPFYPLLLAALSYVTGGLSFAMARGVSLLSSLCILGMLFYVGRRESGILTGIVAAGMYAALYRVCGAFYDLARADSLSLAMTLGATLIAYYRTSLRSTAFVGILFGLAYITKQTSAVIAPFVGLYLLFNNVRRAAVYGFASLGSGLLFAYALDRWSSGWFSFYTIKGHQGHPFSWSNFLIEYWRDLLSLSPFLVLFPALGASYGRYTRWLVPPFLILLGRAFLQRLSHFDYGPHADYTELWYASQPEWLLVPASLMALALLTVRALRRDAQPPPQLFLLTYAGAALASDLNSSTKWAYANCFMPVALFGSLYAALTFGELLRPAAPATRRVVAGALALAAAMFVQFGALTYDPRALVANASDYKALEQLNEVLAQQPGPVLMRAHPLYSYLRDGTIHLHQMGMWDVEFAGGLEDFEQRLASGEFKTVVEDSSDPPQPIARHYELVGRLRLPGDAVFSKTGYRTRPTTLWRYREAPTDAPSGSRAVGDGSRASAANVERRRD